MFVTEMLFGLLRAIGEENQAVRIHKRTRDDVLWRNCLKPWRRSSRWLLLRVALQTSLMEGDGDSRDHSRYKSFMALFMSRILDDAVRASLPGDILFFMGAKISRRLAKLGHATEKFPWNDRINKSISALQRKLSRRWNRVEGNPDLFGHNRQDNLSELLQQEDAWHDLKSIQQYVTGTRHRQSTRPAFAVPEYKPRIEQTPQELPSMKVDREGDIWLVDFETWVQNHLQGWLTKTLRFP